VVTEELLTEDLDRHIDELFVVGHRFETRFVQQTRSTRLVPLGLVEAETAEAAPTFPLYAFTPDADTVLEALIPRYVEARIINILLQSMASEHASRQRAMKTATDNAETQIDKFTRLANTARQGRSPRRSPRSWAAPTPLPDPAAPNAENFAARPRGPTHGE